MKKVITIIMIFLMIINVSGCGLKSKLQGFWYCEDEDVALEFDDDKIVYYSQYGVEIAEYEVKDDKIIITFEGDDERLVYRDVEIDGDELEFYDRDERGRHVRMERSSKKEVYNMMDRVCY